MHGSQLGPGKNQAPLENPLETISCMRLETCIVIIIARMQCQAAP